MIEKGGGGRQGGIMVEKRREIMVGRGGGGICGLMQRRFEVITFRSGVKHVEGRLEKKTL